MSGYIALAPGTEWQANSWLFRFTVRFLADNAGSAAVRERVGEMLEDGFAYFLDVAELPAGDRRRVLDLLREGLYSHAERQLPEDLAQRPLVLEHVRRLTEMARAAPV